VSPEKEVQLRNEFRPIYDELEEFACGDGWFDILFDLSGEVIQACKDNNVPLGAEHDEGFFVRQVKEKYGGLRYYVSYSFTCLCDLIDSAEAKSIKTCEMCGKPGRLKQINSWWVTICPKCEVVK
jgi:hypothetical protein